MSGANQSSGLATETIWPIDRIKDHAAKIGSGITPSGGATSYLDAGIPLLRSQNIHFDGLRLDDVAYIADETHQEMSGTQLRARDVLLNITGASIGRCTFVPDNFGEGNVNQHVCIIRPTARLDYRFLNYCLSAPWGQDQVFSGFTGASRQGLGQRELGEIQVPLPPLPEQQRIVEYLDTSCAAIDAAVVAKRKQLQALEGLRVTTIYRAVTLGIDPAAKLVKSGVEWFDQIPAHWQVDRLKDSVAPKKDAIKVGPFGSDLLLSDMSEEGVKVFNQRTVIDRDFQAGAHFISIDKYTEMKAFTVFPRDLVITTRGTIGRCAIVPDDAPLGILHPCLMRVQTNASKLLPEYLAVLIQDCSLVLRQLQMMSAATTIDVIYSDSLKRTYLPLPPVKEQRVILEFIEERTAALSDLSQNIQRQIDTLVGYRKSLINECVTGKRRITEKEANRALAYA